MAATVGDRRSSTTAGQPTQSTVTHDVEQRPQVLRQRPGPHLDRNPATRS